MAKSHGLRIPDAVWQAFNHLFEKGETGPLADYDTVNAAGVGMFVWTITYPRKHTLAPQIAKLRWQDRTLCYNFLAWARLRDIELLPMLPYPATAPDLLAMAKCWWLGDPELEKFREPPDESPAPQKPKSKKP